MTEDAIRDQLLIAWIFLNFVPWSKACMRRIEQCSDVSIDIGIKPLEVAELSKQERRNNKDMLNRFLIYCRRHENSSRLGTEFTRKETENGICVEISRSCCHPHYLPEFKVANKQG